MPDLEVLVVGGGLSGLSVAYHLHSSKVDEVLVMDAGRGDKASANWINGTQSPELPKFTKMGLTPDDAGYQFLSQEGKIGKERTGTYLSFKSNGVWVQREIATSFDPSMVRTLGSVVLGNKDDRERLKIEHGVYNDLGFSSSLTEFGKKTIEETFSTAKGRFTQGLLIHDDFIIDIDRYVDALAANLSESRVLSGRRLVSYTEKENEVQICYVDKAGNKDTISTRYLVLATNGFWRDHNLRKGMILPHWTYVLSFKDEGPNTPNANYFAENDHYWTRQDNVLLVGGEDIELLDGNFSKPADEEKSIQRLMRWTYDTFPHLEGKQPIAVHYGPFAETPDNLPIAGRFSSESRVFYLVGCNGDGMSALSFAASLFPMIMGYEKPRRRDCTEYMGLVSPMRQSLQKNP